MTESTESRSYGLKPAVLLPALGVAGLLFFLYLPVLRSLVGQWFSDDNYRHGFLIPVISGILIYQRRDRLLAARRSSSAWAGFLVILAAVGLLIVGTAAAELFTIRISLPTFLIGLALFTEGWMFVRVAAFPLLFLYMMIPLPYLIYYKITFPLQIMSAKISAGVLHLLHVSVLRQGNILALPGYSLEVVAACSGLRSLMTLITLALILAVFSGLTLSRRAVLVFCSIPVALLANAFRLIVVAFGAYTISPSFADGFLHQVSGLVVFLTGLGMLLIILAILRRSQ